MLTSGGVLVLGINQRSISVQTTTRKGIVEGGKATSSGNLIMEIYSKYVRKKIHLQMSQHLRKIHYSS
jgi:hypothetical protein